MKGYSSKLNLNPRFCNGHSTQHLFHRGPLARHAKDPIHVERNTKARQLMCLLRRRSSGRHRSSLTSGLLGGRGCGCRLAFTDVALSGRDAVVGLLCPGGLLGPLRILPYLIRLVHSRVKILASVSTYKDLGRSAHSHQGTSTRHRTAWEGSPWGSAEAAPSGIHCPKRESWRQ